VYAARLHLAAFYLAGAYYQWSKRLVRVRYTSLSSSRDRQASYEVRAVVGVAACFLVCVRGEGGGGGGSTRECTSRRDSNHGWQYIAWCCCFAALLPYRTSTAPCTTATQPATCSACVLHPRHTCTC
jgi:hypothetical protein